MTDNDRAKLLAIEEKCRRLGLDETADAVAVEREKRERVELEQRVRMYGAAPVKAPPMALPPCEACGDCTCNGGCTKPAPPPSWPPGPNHLADPVPGQPGRRPACGLYNGSFLEPDEFLSAPLGSLCADCNQLRIARGVEQMQADGYHRPRPRSAVAAAPAARPRLTVACQSSWDPDE